ncbi:Gp15 family bacteriophage protein [Blautia obeum]|uniref:Bacteriophage Gp15 protein n=1 Tax=Blautia obeum TaxID=40520 RepID=A0A414SES5_9FIRM|nr:Gp15 family bacteriophage protein [Blautia obeum]RGK95229.1 hypothetical protein DXC87_02095 [Blautia obeum]RGS13255.1 hypothetical protein DWY10_14505 [Blautia obeum]RHG17759.1 hypothetical protein DW272_06890 [Blautia obeum]
MLWNWSWEKTRESSDPYYDLIDDFDLIISSFQSQYGIRLSRELPEGMKWEEFRDLLVGIAPDTALGRIVSVRAEDRKEYLENFTPEQHRIRNEWKSKHAEFIKNHTTKEQMDAQLDAMKMAFMRMAGLGGD